MKEPMQLVDSLDLASLRRHDGFLRALARGLVIGDADADDVVQDAWVSALRHEGFVHNPGGWLTRVVRRRAADKARGASTRQRNESKGRHKEPMTSPAIIAEREELRNRLVARVLALPTPLREAILLRHYNGLSARAAAEAANVPVETLRTRLKRGYALLRERFLRDEPDRKWAHGLCALGGLSMAAGGLSLGTLALVACLLVSLGAATWAVRHFVLTINPVNNEEATLAGEHSILASDLPSTASPTLVGVGKATSNETTSQSSAATQPRKGCWLIGKVSSPGGFGEAPVAIRIPHPHDDDKSVVSTSDANGLVAVDVSDLFPQDNPDEVLTELEVHFDHPQHMKLVVKVNIERNARRVGRFAQGFAKIPIEASLTPATTWIRGTVQAPPGVSSSHIRVALFHWLPKENRPKAKSLDTASIDDDGGYTLRSHERGLFAVVAWTQSEYGPLCLPNHRCIDIEQANMVVRPIVLEEGARIEGRIEIRGQLEDGVSLVLGVSLERSNHMIFARDVPLIWQDDAFQTRSYDALVGDRGNFTLKGLPRGEIRVRLRQHVVWKGRDLRTYREDRVTLPRWTLTAPSTGHTLKVPIELWLLKVDFGGAAYSNLGVHVKDRSFAMYEVDPDGLVAQFAEGDGTRRQHKFWGGELGVVDAHISPGSWSPIVFNMPDDLATLEIVLDDKTASTNDAFNLYLQRILPDGRLRFMRMPEYGRVREGNTLRYPVLTPGSWTGELKPGASSTVEWDSFLCTTNFDVELVPSETTRAHVTLQRGGYIHIQELDKIATAFGIRGLRYSPGRDVTIRILNAQDQAQELRGVVNKPNETPLPPHGYARSIERPLNRNIDFRLWPALPPGNYRLEVRRPTPSKRRPRSWSDGETPLTDEEWNDVTPHYVPFIVTEGKWTVITEKDVGK